MKLQFGDHVDHKVIADLVDEGYEYHQLQTMDVFEKTHDNGDEETVIVVDDTVLLIELKKKD